jgi:hypothetical protein
MRRRRVRVREFFGVVAAVLAASLVVASPAGAFIFVAPAPNFPDSVVAQTVPAAVGIVNNSTPPESTTDPVITITNIDLYPACTSTSVDCTGGTAEAGVYALSGTGTGQPIGQGGAGCTGTWTIVPDTGNPATATRYRFVPPGGEGTLQLATGQTCVVNFTATARRVPTNDVNATQPGVQTFHVASATAIAPVAAPPPGLRNTGVDTSTVSPATPGLVTAASQSSPSFPGSTTDAATLSPPPGAAAVPPTGTITFNLYGPSAEGPPACTGAPVATRTVPVNGFTTYTTPTPAPVPGPGTYTWVATYSGDANYTPVGPVGCGDPAETVTLGPGQPTIVTTATPSTTVGQPISDTAVITPPSGGPAPTGTVSFSVYGPNNPTCSGTPVFTSIVPVAGSPATASSGPFTPAAPGTYQWVATYSGDVNYSPATSPCGAPNETSVVAARRAVVSDFDGDGDTDPSVFRPTNGVWYLRTSTPAAIPWGTNGDQQVAGDYDGDGTMDVAVYRPATGVWFIRPSTAPASAVAWGSPGSGDVPVPADYDGDNRTDIAVYRNGTWFLRTTTAPASQVSWGTAADVPVPADYDGDGRADLAVYRVATGEWFLNTTTAPDSAVTWGGMFGDVPVPADYDGDGRADVAVYRGGTWILMTTTDTPSAVTWGAPGDIPVPGDYDGDGRADVAVFRPPNGLWFVNNSTAADTAVAWGQAGDQPVPLPSAVRQAFFF